LSNAKYKCAKIQRKVLLKDAVAMIFIDFGLLRSPYCKISYLLADIKIRVKICLSVRKQNYASHWPQTTAPSEGL